jgi:hypothetical protein
MEQAQGGLVSWNVKNVTFSICMWILLNCLHTIQIVGMRTLHLSPRNTKQVHTTSLITIISDHNGATL